MTDIRLNDYLLANGYMLDLRHSGFLFLYPDRPRLVDAEDRIISQKTKDAPFFINGKCTYGELVIDGVLIYEGLTLEEFQEWEATRCCG